MHTHDDHSREQVLSSRGVRQKQVQESTKLALADYLYLDVRSLNSARIVINGATDNPRDCQHMGPSMIEIKLETSSPDG